MNFTESIKEDIIQKALNQYITSNTSTIEERRAIRQAEYTTTHGETHLDSTETDDNITITFTVDGNTYNESIPKSISNIEIQPSSDAPLSFENGTLLAVCLLTGFPWTTESFVAYYTADLSNPDAVSEFQSDQIHILQTYHPPREVHQENHASNTTHHMDFEKLLRYREPNPWEYASLAVVYENTSLAEHLFQKTTLTENDSFEFKTYN